MTHYSLKNTCTKK